MDFLLTFLIFAGCFLGMASGLIIARKALKKGCATAPGETCACGKTNDDPPPEALAGDALLDMQPRIK